MCTEKSKKNDIFVIKDDYFLSLFSTSIPLIINLNAQTTCLNGKKVVKCLLDSERRKKFNFFVKSSKSPEPVPVNIMHLNSSQYNWEGYLAGRVDADAHPELQLRIQRIEKKAS